MKLNQIFFIVIFLFGCSNSTSSNYQYEGDLYSCICDLYTKENVNLPNLISEFEKELINQKLLENNSGENYFNYIDKVLSSKNITPPISLNIQEKFRIINSPISHCVLTLYKSPKREKSRIVQISKKYQSTFEKISTADLDLFKIGNQMMTLMEKEDFDHSFYKVLFIHTWINNSSITESESNNKGITDK